MKDTFWFQHDSNAQHDDRIMELRAEFGWEGYGIFWALIERMRDAQQYRISMATIGGLSAGMGILKPRLLAIIELCSAHGLFSLEEEGAYLFAPSLRRRMETWDNKKAVLAEAGKRGAEAKQAKAKQKPPLGQAEATLRPPLDHPGQNLSREEKSREDEKRLERMDGGQPASQPSSFSSSESEKPAEVKGPPKGLPAQAEVFKTAGFSAYVTKMGFSHIDRGVYLPDIQRKAEMMKQERDEAGWENFVIEFLKKEKAAGKLLTRELGKASEQVHFVVPPPPSQQTTPEAIARQAELDAQAAARTKAHLARWAAKRHTNAAE